MSIKNAVTLLVVVIILMGVMLFIKDKIVETTKPLNYNNQLNQQKTIDSLNDEIFTLQIEVGRYEIALELLQEQDKRAADKFKNILSKQTE
jgi:uncharacterized protein YlxW (UPF0749 family)